jgi:hypothetical protein
MTAALAHALPVAVILAGVGMVGTGARIAFDAHAARYRGTHRRPR